MQDALMALSSPRRREIVRLVWNRERSMRGSSGAGNPPAGRGVARAMCEHSLARARERGFRAMQFNFVVSTNVRAVRLWENFGFEAVGRLAGAFLHPTAGYVDALVMYRSL